MDERLSNSGEISHRKEFRECIDPRERSPPAGLGSAAVSGHLLENPDLKGAMEEERAWSDVFRSKYDLVSALQDYAYGSSELSVSAPDLGWPRDEFEVLVDEDGREEIKVWLTVFRRVFSSLTLLSRAGEQDLTSGEWQTAIEALDRALLALRVRAAALAVGDVFDEAG